MKKRNEIIEIIRRFDVGYDPDHFVMIYNSDEDLGEIADAILRSLSRFKIR